MNILILVLYHISLYFAGTQILRKFKIELPALLFAVGSFLVGMLVGIPVTYGLACLFVKIGKPILWGALATIIVALGIPYVVSRIRDKKKQKPRRGSFVFDRSSIILVIFSLGFSMWLMFKTFHGGGDGQLFVGSNNVFDFGHSVGIIRSFSWGVNIPFMSPFVAGQPQVYHFFFYFWVAVLEYFGIPLVWAMNIPSIVSFASFLIVAYFLPQMLLLKKSIIGWLAVLLTITHSTLTFWYVVMQKGIHVSLFSDIWRLPTYPFAGPFDGSVISIFMTLNTFVNQRHLAFSIAVIIFLYMVIAKELQNRRWNKQRTVITFILIGLMPLWNSMIFIVGVAAIFLLFIIEAYYIDGLVFGIGVSVVALISYFPWLSNIIQFIIFFQHKKVGAVSDTYIQITPWSYWLAKINFWWQNLGILPFFVIWGSLYQGFRKVRPFIPLLLLSIVVCVLQTMGVIGIDEKLYALLIVGINAVVATFMYQLWGKRVGMKLAVIIILFILTISGFVDLMAIKNEFAFPLVSQDMVKLIAWIHTSTSKQSVFLSYADMLDPVAFAGRKNYFGFFRNPYQEDRTAKTKALYETTTAEEKRQIYLEHISYIILPKWQKNDFPYIVDEQKLRMNFHAVYEDAKFLVVKTLQ